MRSNFLYSKLVTLLGCLFFLGLAGNASAQNTSFSGVDWTRDGSNTPEQDTSGCGSTPTPSTSGTTLFTFTLTGCSSGTQRQEFKYERRSGIHAMVGRFWFNDPDYNEAGAGVSVAQTHDDSTGSDGVFSIYRLHYRDANNGGRYYLTPQTDETGYSSFSWARVYPDTSYYLDIQTYTDGSDSFERARIWRGTSSGGTLLKTWTIDDGSGDDDTQYKKIGAYALTDSAGTSIEVNWYKVKLYTGEW